MSSASIDRIGPYIDRFLDNNYARESLDDAVSALRDAYRRGMRKGAAAPADRKFRDRVTDAIVAMRETADAVQTGRRRSPPAKACGRRCSARAMTRAPQPQACPGERRRLRLSRGPDRVRADPPPALR
jgi:hypothetical protein